MDQHESRDGRHMDQHESRDGRHMDQHESRDGRHMDQHESRDGRHMDQHESRDGRHMDQHESRDGRHMDQHESWDGRHMDWQVRHAMDITQAGISHGREGKWTGKAATAGRAYGPASVTGWNAHGPATQSQQGSHMDRQVRQCQAKELIDVSMSGGRQAAGETIQVIKVSGQTDGSSGRAGAEVGGCIMITQSGLKRKPWVRLL